MILIQDFIEENLQEIEKLHGYRRLCEDLEFYSVKLTVPMANNLILKNLLANEYGTVTDVSLAKLCRNWLQKGAEEET